MVAERIDRQSALDVAIPMLKLMEPHCERIEIAGSIRRGKADVKDIELVLIPGPTWHSFTDGLLSDGYFEKRHGWGQKSRFGVHVESGISVDMFTATPENWGSIFHLRTGPDDANAYIMTWLKRSNAPIRTEGGYWWHNNHKLRIGSEMALFNLLGFPYIEPEERSVERYRQAVNVPDRQRPDFTQFYLEEPRLVEDPQETQRERFTPVQLAAIHDSDFKAVYSFYDEHFAAGMDVTDERLSRIAGFAQRAGVDVTDFIDYWRQYQE